MKEVLEAFIALFVIMDPVGNLPIFISLTKGMPAKEIKINAKRSIIVASVIFFVFLFMGTRIFGFFMIDFSSFQIAGGLILLVIGMLYVLGLSSNMAKAHGNDLSVPIGTPLLTGPGTITTTIILANQKGIIITFIAGIAALCLTWAVLMNATRIYKFLGEHWTNVVSRIMGIILAAIAIKFIKEGIIAILSAKLI